MQFSQVAIAAEGKSAKSKVDKWKRALGVATAFSLAHTVSKTTAQGVGDIAHDSFKQATKLMPVLKEIDGWNLDTSEFEAVFKNPNKLRKRKLPNTSRKLSDIDINKKMLIIGAGPAGIDMARRLENMGFNDVTVLEASNEIGGKSKTVELEDTKFDMGTTFILSNSTTYASFIDLLKEYDVDTRVPKLSGEYFYAPTSCALAQNAPGCDQIPLDLGSLIIGNAFAVDPGLFSLGIPLDQLPLYILGQVLTELTTYVNLYFQIFGMPSNPLDPNS